MALNVQVDPSHQVIEDVVRHVERPKGVGEPKFAYEPDYSGEPSVYITYPVSKSVPLTKARAQQLADLTFRTVSALNRPDVELLAYVRYSETR